jgi:hypothetical protein
VLADTTNTATAEETAAIDVFNEQLLADGHWIFAGGLASPSTATVIDRRGPLDHSPDLDVALRLATLVSKH